MERDFEGLPVQKAIPLFDNDYYPFLLSKIRNATWRVWASIFIVNVQRDDDKNKQVRLLLQALSEAKDTGVSVRLLIGDSSTSAGIRYSNMVSRSYARHLGVRVKRHQGAEESSSHDKFVLIDNELIILGSHNWTERAFNESFEDSVAIYSEPMCKLKELEFHDHWVKGVNK